LWQHQATDTKEKKLKKILVKLLQVLGLIFCLMIIALEIWRLATGQGMPGSFFNLIVYPIFGFFLIRKIREG
jgi:hypothetical protein